MDKVILAYSGGLDTSVILKWLAEKGYEVIAYVADVGQNEDLDAVARKARATGAVKVYVEDLKDELVSEYVFAAVKANAIYEGRYLLGTSIARPIITKRHIEIAHKEGARIVAHGATGKGNDQVRFELGYYALDPDIKIISPWKDTEFLAQFQGRPDLIAYAEAHGIEVKASKSKPYSEDANLIHISHESGILEDPALPAAEDVYSWTKSPQDAPDKGTDLEVHSRTARRQSRRPDQRSDQNHAVRPVHLPQQGRGRRTGSVGGHGRERFVGVKSRMLRDPGLTILRAAHLDIEGVAMDREVMRLRDMLSPKFSELVYNGFWYSPEMEFLMAAINKSQEVIDGIVRLTLYKGNVMVTSRESPSSLYDRDLSSMDIEGGFNQQDSKGFIAVNAIRLKAHKAIMTKRGKKVTDFMRNGQ